MHKVIDNNYIKINKDVNLLILVILGITLSFLENLIPINFILPGFKLGLSNAIFLSIVYIYGLKYGLKFLTFRVLIVSFIMGSFSIFLFSTASALCSFVITSILYKFNKYISIYTISIFGAICANIGQIIFAMIYLQTTSLIYYIPILLVISPITGIIVGILANNIIPTIKRNTYA